jgi:hypothetical protein
MLGFTITAGGRGEGDTNIKVEIKPQHFPILLAMMARVDREATLRAMANELHNQLCWAASQCDR